MGIYLTNGKCYIAHSATGAVIKVKDLKEAQDFHSIERAIAQKDKAPGKCSGYYFINTAVQSERGSAEKVKRKVFTPEERKAIYRKTRGRCYICGEFVDYDSFEIEHRIPLAKGGTNDFENTFCSCHICNTMKGSITPVGLMEKIKQIHLYQIRRKCVKNRNSLKWKIAYKALQKLS